MVKLECVIAAGGEPWRRTPKVLHFRADPIALSALLAAGIDAVSLANNHVLDFEVPALLEMLDRLDAVGIVRAGAGRDLTEAARPGLLQVKDIRVALTAFTDNEPDWAASATTAGTNYVPVSIDTYYLARMRQAIEAARAGGADLVLCSAHWGPNMRQRPTPVFREFARAVLEAGADLYFGHSAHVFHGIEMHHGKPILYDLGDFVDYYAVDPALRNDQSLLWSVTASERGLRKVEALPVVIARCQVNLAEGGDFEQIASRFRTLSAEMGTEVGVVNRHLRVLREMEASTNV